LLLLALLLAVQAARPDQAATSPAT
jgi:hypothetical protein